MRATNNQTVIIVRVAICFALCIAALIYAFGCKKPENKHPYEVNAVLTRPYEPHLTVQNNRLYLDGEPFKINEANSPESRLRECDFAELDQLNACGINTIYATLYGGDVTSIHPFINRSNPSAGFNDVVVDRWVAYLEHWIYGYPGQKHIVHLLLSEKENHFTLTEAQSKAMMQYFAQKFRNFEGYIIYNREELPTGRSAYINTYYSYLRQVAPYSIRGLHNNTGENPWSGFGYHHDSLIQFLALQEWHGNFDRRIRQQVALGNWAAYASEVTGGFQTHPGCSTLTATLANAGGDLSSGLGYFISSKDHSTPNFHGSYCGCYQYGAQLLGQGGTTTPPPAGSLSLFFSANAQTNAQRLDSNEVIPIGGYNIFIPNAQGKAPCYWTLKKNGTVQPGFPKTENAAPWEHWGGNNYNFTQGSYSIKVETNGLTKEIPFSIGTTEPTDTVVTPPPPVSITVEWSRSYTKNPAYLLTNGSTLPVAGYWFFVRTGTPTFSFTLTRSGSPGNVVNTTDSSAPFDMMGNGNKYLIKGSYTLVVKDGNNQSVTVQFTVQ